MGHYAYPQVRPPSAMQIGRPADREPQPITREERHFSYIQTPIEARGGDFGRLEADSNIPPLPQVPEHLAMDRAPPLAPAQEASPKHQQQYPPDAKHNMYPNEPWRSASRMQATAQQPLVLENSACLTDPARKQPTIPIAPDENPLTPITPQRAHTTNLAILPPSSPAYSAQFSSPLPSVSGGSWEHDLCSCAEPSICMASLFCPCVVYGKTQYRLTQRTEKKDPTNMLGYTVMNGSCAAFAILCGINGILAAIQHTRVRKAYGMGTEAGNVVGDCVKGVCCCCCTVAQDEKEVKRREESVKDGKGLSKAQYQTPAPGGMLFAAPPR